MEALNENIRALRLQTGMSQVELAEKIGVSKQCVSNWENDNVAPSVEMLMKLADLFGVTTDALLGREPAETVDVSGIGAKAAGHIRLIVDDLRKK